MPTAPDITAAAIVAPLDPRLSPADLHVLNPIATWPHLADLNEVIRAGDITLNRLWQRTGLSKPVVFAAVARLEDAGMIPAGAIR